MTTAQHRDTDTDTHTHTHGHTYVCTPLPFPNTQVQALTIALLENLLRSAVVVSKRVVGVGVLVKDHRVRDLLVQLVGNANV